MVTKEQLLNGILSYIENDIIPSLPTAGKWGLGTISVLVASRYNDIFAELIKNPVIKAMNVVDDNGMIHIDTLGNAIKQSAEKYGQLVVAIPLLGTMSFSAKDIDRLRERIGE